MIDIAERNNPRARIAWEQAQGAAERVGISRSEYLPKLVGLALFGDERIISPFPEPLAPVGYVMVEIPTVNSGLELEYTIFDFGRRKSTVQASRARWFAASSSFQRTTQDVAYRVMVAYYDVVTTEDRLAAIRQILNTARITRASAEAQLEQGRATLPDVLNARAGTAKAEYDLEAAAGDEVAARVRLRDALGVEPSDAIHVQKPTSLPSADTVSSSVTALIDQAMRQRPDLRALSERLHAAEADVDTARSAYRPTVQWKSNAASQSIWPKFSQPNLGNTTQFVWSVGVQVRWELFDGGARKHELLLRQTEKKQAEEELREKRDEITRDTWVAYVGLKTASREYEAARSLLDAATSSYNSSMEAYGYGVKSLIDVVTAEAQLSQARLAVVQAQSAVHLSAATLGYTTGNLLQRNRPAQEPPR